MALAQRLAAIPASPLLRLVPVRHHSPACAWQLRTLIRRDRPQRVLIEGPVEASGLVRFLGMSGTRPPLALYTCLPAAGSGTRARRAFYPMAEFSPEFVAVREGLRCGAEVRFIDRPAAALLEDRAGEDASFDDAEDDEEADPSLLADDGLEESARSQRLVEASGCRDFDHWWDRHFESGCQHLAPDAYFERLLQWCLLLREPPEPAACSARERAMAAQVAAAAASGERTLVVTGGLHVEAIALLLRQSSPLPVEAADGRAECYLIPYNLQRLDTAQAYAAGLPDTGYYQLLWEALQRGGDAPERTAAQSAALRVLAGLRGTGEPASLPDAIEAVMMAERLAALRTGPLGRAEVLDALAGALPKEALDADGAEQIRHRLRTLLAADRVGRLPRQYPRAPLVEDFRRRAAALGLPLLPGGGERALDVYRSEKHREISRLLHQLRLLEVPYAELRAGPDFVAGTGLERVRELWSIGWRPEVDARLTECLHLGAQLPEAALSALLQHARRHPAEAASCLLEGLRMGLHAQMEPLLGTIRGWALHEGSLPTLVRGLAQLAAAAQAREVLAADALPGLSALLAQIYARAVGLLAWLGHMDTAAAHSVIEALATLNTLASEAWADLDLLLDALARIVDARLPDLLRGRIAGILCARGRSSRTDSAQRLRVALDSGLLQPERLCDYLLGFLPLARHVLLGEAALIEAFNAALREWEEPLFLQLLPGLRLAFTALKPREAASLMEAIAGRAGAAGTRVLQLDADHLEQLAHLRADTARAAAAWGCA